MLQTPTPQMATLHRSAATVLLLASATALLSACGGGGGSIASAPPPLAAAPTPAPAPSLAVVTTNLAAPATRPGTYDTIALIEHYPAGNPASSRLAAPSDVRITTYQPGPTSNDVSYTIQFGSPDLPGGLSSLTTVVEGESFNASANGSFGGGRGPGGQYPLRFGQELTATLTNSDGSRNVLLSQRYSTALPDQTSITVNGKILDYELKYDIGLSFVSLGAWNWESFEPRERGGNLIEGGIVRFVHGDRTPAAAIPTSGTASYTATTLASSDGDYVTGFGYFVDHPALRFALTADFGQSSISTRINQAFNNASCGDCFTEVTPGLDLSGTGSMARSGNFNIPLTGTMTSYVQGDLSAPVATFAVSGALDGAFFGPHAEQIGGVFAVGQAPGAALFGDAFVGTRN